MSCPETNNNTSCCTNRTRSGNGYVFIIVLYILLAIILGCSANNTYY